MEANRTGDFISDYLKTLDHELEGIDKRMRLMMSSVESHSQLVRSKALSDTHTIKPIPKTSFSSLNPSGQRLGKVG